MKTFESIISTIFIVASIIIVVYVLHSHPINSETRKYVYTCIDKKEKIGSEYSLILGDWHTETEYNVILKDSNEKIVAHKVSLNEYYQYEIGKTYSFKYPVKY